jgi:hypothetical protein
VSNPQQKPQAAIRNKASTRHNQVFHTVSVDHLNNHVGHKTKITMHDGRVREGILNTVNDWRIQLVVRTQTGSMSFPVKIADIKKVRVRY